MPSKEKVTPSEAKALVKEYQKGQTSMQALGKKYGISRERVRQIIEQAHKDAGLDGSAADAVVAARSADRVKRQQAKVAAVRKVLRREVGAVERQAILDEAQISERDFYTVMSDLEPHERVRIVTSKPVREKYSASVIKKSLVAAQKALREETGTRVALSRAAYDRLRAEGSPTSGAITRRYGSWKAALIDNGLKVNERSEGAGAARVWDTDEIVEWVRQYIDAVAAGEISGRTRPSSRSFGEWSSERGGPSDATVLSRMGWTAAVERALSLPRRRKARVS